MSIAGRTEVTARALQRTVSAIAAEHLGVPARDVSVTLSDDGGALGIGVVAPVRLPPLGESTSARVLSSSRAARDGIRSATTVTVGRTVGSVSVRLTRAVVLREKRVR